MTLIFIIIIAAIIGSFLNMLIYRLPRMITGEHISLIHPKRSICPKCTHQLNVKDLFPLLSYIMTAGKCRYCAQKINIRYLLVEIVTILNTLFLYHAFGLSAEFIYFSVLNVAFIILFCTDLETHIVPDIITIPALWIGMLYHLQLGDIHSSIIGAIAGYLSLWLLFWVFKIFRNKEAMGYGDFKLLALIGAWFGWQILSLVLLIAALLGIVFYLVKIKDKNQEFAFGSWMILATPFALTLQHFIDK